jgi:hypothetical protein
MERDISNFEHLPKDAILEIAEELDFPDIQNLCSTSKKFNSVVCKNGRFWLWKLKGDFPNSSYFYIEDMIKNETKPESEIAKIARAEYAWNYFGERIEETNEAMYNYEANSEYRRMQEKIKMFKNEIAKLEEEMKKLEKVISKEQEEKQNRIGKITKRNEEILSKNAKRRYLKFKLAKTDIDTLLKKIKGRNKYSMANLLGDLRKLGINTKFAYQDVIGLFSPRSKEALAFVYIPWHDPSGVYADTYTFAGDKHRTPVEEIIGFLSNNATFTIKGGEEEIRRMYDFDF